MARSETDHQYDMCSDFLFRIMLIGDCKVGKSSLLARYIDNEYDDMYKCTIGVEMRSPKVKVNAHIVKLQIWDTSGEEKFKVAYSSNYRATEAILLVFDVTNQKTFKHIIDWYEEVRATCKQDCKYILIGNKCDLETERAVSSQQAQELADSLYMKYMETSAKHGSNVTELFTAVTSDLVDGYRLRYKIPDSHSVEENSTTPPTGAGCFECCFDCCIL